MSNDFNPANKNRHMRRMAYVSLIALVGLIAQGSLSSEWAPGYVFAALTGIIATWAGFSKWGEIEDAKSIN